MASKRAKTNRKKPEPEAATRRQAVALLRVLTIIRSEFGERLRVIESDIEKIQLHMGRLALKPLGNGPLEPELTVNPASPLKDLI
jgi:hypothetical protein